MDLKTSYLGLNLNSPLVAGASPLSDDLDNIRHLEDAGASAVVFYSLFEEQLNHEQYELHFATTENTYSSAEAQTYFPDYDNYRIGPDGYLQKISNAKEAVNIPIIASLNGCTHGGWIEFAKMLESAGADAIEINNYSLNTDYTISPVDIENNNIQIASDIRKAVSIPVSVKLSPYYTNLSALAKRYEEIGIDGLVLFNRFYQPDIDLEQLEIVPKVALSTSSDIRLPLTWIGILKNKIKLDFAASSGIHTADDVLKMMMVGANATFLVSTLLRNGIDYLRVIEKDLVDWMEAKEYVSIKQMQGSMSQQNTSDPSAFERAQYLKALTQYQYIKK